MKNNSDYAARCIELEKKVNNMKSLVSHHKRIADDLIEERKILNRLILDLAYRSKVQLAEEILYRLEKQSTKEDLEKAILISLRQDLGDKEKAGSIQPLVNYLYGGVIDRLREDYPSFSPFELNLFCCMLSGIKASMLKYVFSFPKVYHVYYAQKELIRKIWKGGSRHRVKYAQLLEKKDWAYWKNLLPLHDLTINRNGKDKKDKD